MVENEKLVGEGCFETREYPKSLDYNERALKEIIYASKENAYFFMFSNHLYRKDIDSRPPRPILEVENEANKNLLRYSERTNRLFISQTNRILIFNLMTSKLEGKIPTGLRHQKRHSIQIEDFILVEEVNQPLKVLEVSNLTHLALSTLSSRKEDSVARYDLSEEVHRRDWFPDNPKLTICPENKFALLEMSPRRFYEYCYEDEDYTTKYYLFELGSNSIQLKRSIQLENVNTYSLYPRFHSYALKKNHLVFTQVYFERIPDLIQHNWMTSCNFFLGVVDYNVRTGEMRFFKTNLTFTESEIEVLYSLDHGDHRKGTTLLSIHYGVYLRELTNLSLNSLE